MIELSHDKTMDAQNLKAEIERLRTEHESILLKHEREKNVLLTSLEAAMATIKRLKDNPDNPIDQTTYDVMIEIFLEQIRRRNQIIRELIDWMKSEFRLDAYPPDSAGRKLWDRAAEAVK